MRTFIFALVLALLSPVSLHADTPEILLAGAAKQEITPPAGTPLGGYGRRHGRPSEGVHDPLFARALALTRGRQTVVFASLDLVLIDTELREAIVKKIRGKIPFDDSAFILTATHDHSGSGAYGGRFWQRFILGKRRDAVFNLTAEKTAEAVLLSLKARAAVSAEYAETAMNDMIENRMDENLFVPLKAQVLRFKNEKGGVTASAVFMPAHPTMLPASNMKFSADYPGVLCAELERHDPGSTAVFINGAAADLRPHGAVTEDRFEKMTLFGQAAAEQLEKLSFVPAELDGPWTAVLEKRKLPGVKARAGFIDFPSFLGGQIFPRRSDFQAVRMGQLAVFAFPGELGSEPGHEIEKHFELRGLKLLFAGYANDYIGYAVSPRHYLDRKQYESRASFYGPKMSWKAEQAAIDLAEKLLTDDEKKNLRPEGKLKFNQGLPVLYLRGDPYHAGFEEGRLLKDEIHKTVADIYDYLNGAVHVPLAGRWLIDFSAGRAWNKMEPYITYSEYLQIKGIAKGSGIPFETLKRMHALPEVYPSWCTNGAYWGKATADGRMIAVRNLDWNRQMGVHRHAAVKFIAIPGRKKYVNIGYAGFAGVLSGMNEAGISAGQVGASSVDETLEGVPMPFVLKRVMEETGSEEDAADLIKRAVRTRGYNYIIASAKQKKALALETTHSRFASFTDNDPEEKAGYALKVENAVFRGDPAMSPEIRELQTASGGKPDKPGLEMPKGSAYEIRYLKHGRCVLDHYGKITPQTAMEIAKTVAPGSNIQSVVFAFPEFWAANAKDRLKAAETPYVHFSGDFFSAPDKTESQAAEKR